MVQENELGEQIRFQIIALNFAYCKVSLIYCKMKVWKDNKDSMQNRRNKNNNWKFDLAWNFLAASHMPD